MASSTQIDITQKWRHQHTQTLNRHGIINTQKKQKWRHQHKQTLYRHVIINTNIHYTDKALSTQIDITQTWYYQHTQTLHRNSLINKNRHYTDISLSIQIDITQTLSTQKDIVSGLPLHLGENLKCHPC